MLEDIAKVLIAGVMLYPKEKDEWLQMTHKELANRESSTPGLLIIISSALLAVIALMVLGLIYLYRCFKVRDDADQDTLPSIVSRVISTLFSFYGTFVHILTSYFLLYSYFYLSLSSSYSQ